MKGYLLDYAISEAKGVISADNDRRYAFEGKDWKAASPKPQSGLRVDFIAHETTAIEVYPDVTAPSEPPTARPSQRGRRNGLANTNPVTIVLLIGAAAAIALGFACVGIQQTMIDQQLHDIHNNVQNELQSSVVLWPSV